MKILSIIVTYRPNKDLLKTNFAAFVDDIDKVLIWENTPEEEKCQYRFVQHEKVEYCGDGINSISHALNYAWKYAKTNGYDYLLTMDQDSVFENFKGYLERTLEATKSVDAIWGPNAYDKPSEDIVECDYLITSGMLLKVSMINTLGGWNEGFPIDCVDDEFCLRAKSKGIKSYYWGKCFLHQTYGTPRKLTFFFGEVTLRNDPPRRLFSIYKSHILLKRMFPENETVRKDVKEIWIPMIKWILVFEKNRIRKFIAIFRGIFQGLTCNIQIID